jgi:hypothetical protein
MGNNRPHQRIRLARLEFSATSSLIVFRILNLDPKPIEICPQ